MGSMVGPTPDEGPGQLAGCGRGRAASRSASVSLKKFEILEMIAKGGMAEVYRARTTGLQGFEKEVCVKKILPHLTEDESFVTMFINEAKLAATLSYANIVQVHDLCVSAGGEYFIVMEYVDGKDLSDVIRAAQLSGLEVPPEIAVHIGREICQGLAYAHSRTDRAGAPLQIIHRDVSPHNVLVSFMGEVKLVDFGIAKASSIMSKTAVGILKGKYGYMSPEQARGQPLDARSDIFNTGIVLYELLVGERCFAGSSDFSTLNLMRNAEVVPPTQVNGKVPESLEAVVLKALAKERADRPQTALELEGMLAAWAKSSGAIATKADLARFMQGLFRDGGARGPSSKTGVIEIASVVGPPPAAEDKEPPPRRSTERAPSLADRPVEAPPPEADPSQRLSLERVRSAAEPAAHPASKKPEARSSSPSEASDRSLAREDGDEPAVARGSGSLPPPPPAESDAAPAKGPNAARKSAAAGAKSSAAGAKSAAVGAKSAAVGAKSAAAEAKSAAAEAKSAAAEAKSGPGEAESGPSASKSGPGSGPSAAKSTSADAKPAAAAKAGPKAGSGDAGPAPSAPGKGEAGKKKGKQLSDQPKAPVGRRHLRPGLSRVAPPPKRRRTAFTAAAVLVVAAAGGLGFGRWQARSVSHEGGFRRMELASRRAPEPDLAVLVVEAKPGTEVFVDGEQLAGSAPLAVDRRRDDAEHRVELRRGDAIVHEAKFDFRRDAVAVIREPSAERDPPKFARLELVAPPRASVTVDGRPAGRVGDGALQLLPGAREVVLELGKRRRSFRVRLDPGASRTLFAEL